MARPMRTAVTKVSDSGDDEALLVKSLIYLGGDDCELGPLCGQRGNALRCGNKVEEEDLLLLYAVVEEDLDGLDCTAAGC